MTTLPTDKNLWQELPYMNYDENSFSNVSLLYNFSLAFSLYSSIPSLYTVGKKSAVARALITLRALATTEKTKNHLQCKET